MLKKTATRQLADSVWIWLAIAVLVPSCGSSEDSWAAATEETATPIAEEAIEQPPEPEPLPTGLGPIVEPWTGDLDDMVERRVVRVLVVNSPLLYFVDKGRKRGLTYEAVKAFEKHLNKSLGMGVVQIHVIPLPVARDELIPRLLGGQGDIAAALLTITPKRRQQVDFSDPFVFASLDELSGITLHVRASSNYAEHLAAFNARRLSEGKSPVEVVPADEALEAGDLLEMVNAGLIPGTVVDSYLADRWKQVFPKIVVHSEIPFVSGSEIAWAFRKGSPKLAAAVNTFARGYKQGTLHGNILINKYLRSTKWVRNAHSQESMARFRNLGDLFQQYADQYNFDWLLMAAQGYQESQLDQSKVSRAGAIGVMQMMPPTARSKAVNIPDIDNFYADPAIDALNRTLFVLASYNAGPSRVARLRKEAEENGLDPNRWFDNVELIAAKRIGRETVQYVANIYKYYLAYQFAIQHEKGRQQRLKAVRGG
jgi:membrane-bound lytic murein transglycosylase MltF